MTDKLRRPGTTRSFDLRMGLVVWLVGPVPWRGQLLIVGSERMAHDPPPPLRRLPPLDRLGRSELGSLILLGSGGQGSVYHAPRARTNYAAAVAFKEYKPAEHHPLSTSPFSAAVTGGFRPIQACRQHSSPVF